MRLTLNDFSRITLGVDRVTEEDGKLRFHRFSECEELFYKHRDDTLGRSFSARCLASAGAKLAFCTDSRHLTLTACLTPATSRSYFSFDVIEDGKLLGSLDNFSEAELPLDYTETPFPLGSHARTFSLSAGESTVEIHLPWSVRIDDLSLELDDGATLTPVRKEKRLLAYGDSITQGYDATRPSHRYVTVLADALRAEEHCKANGGEIFVPELANMRVPYDPDYITVAYGTNDWSTTDGSDFSDKARRFYRTLREQYPNARIFAITPIWRANLTDEKPFGAFSLAEERIRDAVEDLPNVTLISGIDLVGHDRALFADLRLHPRDAGFAEYAENLIRKVKEAL